MDQYDSMFCFPAAPNEGPACAEPFPRTASRPSPYLDLLAVPLTSLPPCRFGVEQRSALQRSSSPTPHVLSLSATPIPRTLALVAHGDMDISIISERPPGRTPVKTRVRDLRMQPGGRGGDRQGRGCAGVRGVNPEGPRGTEGSNRWGKWVEAEGRPFCFKGTNPCPPRPQPPALVVEGAARRGRARDGGLSQRGCMGPARAGGGESEGSGRQRGGDGARAERQSRRNPAGCGGVGTGRGATCGVMGGGAGAAQPEGDRPPAVHPRAGSSTGAFSWASKST